ncbi:hypothetical protein MRX96_025430 [Rhipicephalus microplus]
MEAVEEVLTSTAAGGQHPKGSPLYGERLSPYTVSGGPHLPTAERRERRSRPRSNPRLLHQRARLPTSPQPFGKAPTAVDTTRRHSSAAGSPPDTEGFQVVTTRGARRRARDLAAAAALPVDPAIVGTVLFRPSAPGGTFSGSPRLILAQALSARPGVAAIRVNQKRNIVAAHATTQECLQ